MMVKKTITLLTGCLFMVILVNPLTGAEKDLSGLSVEDLMVFTDDSDFDDPDRQLLDYFGHIADQAFARRQQMLDSVKTPEEFDAYPQNHARILPE